MAQGTVKWFNCAQGFGFIAPDDGSKNAFVPITSAGKAGLNGLCEGLQVDDDLVPAEAGREAADNLRIRD